MSRRAACAHTPQAKQFLNQSSQLLWNAGITLKKRGKAPLTDEGGGPLGECELHIVAAAGVHEEDAKQDALEGQDFDLDLRPVVGVG